MSKYEIVDFFKGYATVQNLEPETWLTEYVVNVLPSYVKYVVDFGCASGRNFTPFPVERYTYIGFDIHSQDSIVWKNEVKVNYYQCSLEDFLHNYEQYEIDWSTSLVMTHGTLMYFDNSDLQNKFLNLLRGLGCKNFALHEYGSNQLILNNNLSDRARNGKLGWLDLDSDNQALFTPPQGDIFKFRDFENDMCAFISLDK